MPIKTLIYSNLKIKGSRSFSRETQPFRPSERPSIATGVISYSQRRIPIRSAFTLIYSQFRGVNVSLSIGSIYRMSDGHPGSRVTLVTHISTIIPAEVFCI